MKRDQLEHLIRASAAIASDDEIVIVGSQSVLGQFPDAPAELLVSDEADGFPMHHPDRADLIDGSIGELSTFHDTFGDCAPGVSPETAVLPPDWQTRLVPVRTPATRGATGWCLEIHDLLLSKYVAGREKDATFCRVAVVHRMVRRETLEARLAQMELVPAIRAAVTGRINADFAFVAATDRGI